MSHSQVSLATVRQFQSETDAIREAAEPLVARATLFVLSAFLVSIIVILCLTRVDRVITAVTDTLRGRGQQVPDGVTAANLVTNQFIDAAIGLRAQ